MLIFCRISIKHMTYVLGKNYPCDYPWLMIMIFSFQLTTAAVVCPWFPVVAAEGAESPLAPPSTPPFAGRAVTSSSAWPSRSQAWWLRCGRRKTSRWSSPRMMWPYPSLTRSSAFACLGESRTNTDKGESSRFTNRLVIYILGYKMIHPPTDRFAIWGL